MCSVDYDECWFFFFFQAEDGIRDLTVTGVQTCALPISRWTDLQPCVGSRLAEVECFRTLDRVRLDRRIDDDAMALALATARRLLAGEIGRASCRGRV